MNYVYVPMLDLSKQYLSIRQEVNLAISKVLESGRYILGQVVEDFEKDLCNYCGSRYSVGVASGTDALFLSILALGIGEGDEVITTPFTFAATTNAIIRSGAKPIFVDIDPETFTIDPNQISEVVTNRTKLLLPVHLFGQAANMDKLKSIAMRHDLALLEDAAQAIGARYNGKQLGTLGDVGILSFYPTKNLGAYGDGGAVLTDNVAIAERVDILRSQGAKQKYWHEVVGINSRLDALQAAVLATKLKYLDLWNRRRRTIAHNYNSALNDLRNAITTPHEFPNSYHVYHQYTILVPKRRNELKTFLSGRGVETAIYYPTVLNKQPFLSRFGMNRRDFPVAEMVSQSSLSLPCFPEMTSHQEQYVSDAIHEFFSK